MKYLVWFLAVGLIGVVAAPIMAGYCLWLTTTSLSYARVNTVENEFLLSVGVFFARIGRFSSDYHALGSIKAAEAQFENNANPEIMSDQSMKPTNPRPNALRRVCRDTLPWLISISLGDLTKVNIRI